jgi:hypothetical protein
MTFVLMLLDEFNQVATKIMSPIKVIPVLGNKCRLLLMMRSRSSLLGWVLAHLVCGDNNRMKSFCALCTHILPAAIFITVM